LFKPVARGWRKLPDIPRDNFANLASTAKTPVSLANAILQLDKESIGNILGRFLMNMTFGLGGLFDVAGTESFGGVKQIII
jgi:phospholipid-binding lipoprotein MlaA